MTRGNLMIVLVLILALVGMFFWTLTLHNRQADLYAGGGLADDGLPAPAGTGRFDDLEQEVREVRLLIRSGLSDLNLVERRVAELEKSRDLQDGRLAALAAGGPPTIAGSGATAGDAGLRDAVEAVLAEKRAEELKASVLRRAQGMTRYLLSEVDATEDQRKQFTGLVVTYIDERSRVRAEFSGTDGGSEARDAALARVTEDRDEAIRQLFPAAYTKIQPRLERGRRWLDGRTRSPRGTGNRAGPRGNPR